MPPHLPPKPTTRYMNRQIRLSTIDQLQKRLKDFTGKKINIVMRNRKVLFGELKNADETQLTFVNMRNERFTLLLKEITEIYLDSKQ
jgi:hypothetical protein